jgi:transposase InsO family protein
MCCPGRRPLRPAAHSPKLNGAVERANRTHAEEFYELAWGEPDLARLDRALRRWERTYNTVPPHQALGYLTPAEFVERWRAAHPQTDVYRTCRTRTQRSAAGAGPRVLVPSADRS